MSVAVTRSAQRIVAWTFAYALVLQALFGAGGQLHAYLHSGSGLCTLSGFRLADDATRALADCATQCAAQLSVDSAHGVAFAPTPVAAPSQAIQRVAGDRASPLALLAYWGRAPPDIGRA